MLMFSNGFIHLTHFCLFFEMNIYNNTNSHPSTTPEGQVENLVANILIMLICINIIYICCKNESDSRPAVEYIVSTRASAYI